MARSESDKEDLIADATSLVERAEYDCVLNATKANKITTVGFRRDDSLSLYFEQDPFYQFDSNGLLRRSYEKGFLYRSQGDTLAKLDRHRSETKTTLQRSDLSETQLAEFRQRMRQHLTALLQFLHSGDYNRLRCISERGDIDQRTISALQTILTHEVPFLAGRIAVRK
jgi:hypothetical protein